MKKRTAFFLKFSRAIAALFLIPAFCFTAASCSDDDDDDPADPNLVNDMPASVTLAATEASNTATIEFTAALAWKAAYATEADEWFTFTPEAGTTAGKVSITVSAPQNPDAAKSGKIIITHGTKSYTVTVNQNAGGDDPAQWNKTDLQGTVFAPDSYNTSESAVAEKTFTVTNTFDYATLEEAPFEIFTFYVNPETNQVQDSIIEWVNFKIAENSPVAKEGKKIVVSVKPHEEILIEEKPNNNPDLPNIISYEMLDRIACIVLAPKGTATQDVFANGEIKEEYTSALIRQDAYKADVNVAAASINWMLPTFMMTPNPASVTITNLNFKVAGLDVTYLDEDFKDWVSTEGTPEGNNYTVKCTCDVTKFTAVNPVAKKAEIRLKINRGEELTPFIPLHIAAITAQASKMF